MRKSLPTLALLPLVASAAFFLKRPTTPNDFLERLDAQHLQQSPISINGTPGSLDLYAIPLSALDLETKLASLNPQAAAKIFLLPCGSPEAPQCLAFVIDTNQPTTSPTHWPWPDLPPAGGFQPSFSASLNNELTSFVAGESSLHTTAAHNTWSAHLASLGWIPVSPAPSHTSLTLFSKKNETIALTTIPLPSGSSRISILRRATNQ